MSTCCSSCVDCKNSDERGGCPVRSEVARAKGRGDPKPLRSHNARASRRPSASGVSSFRGAYSGRTMSD